MASDPVATPPDTKPTMASDPPHIKLTMIPDPAAFPLPISPIITPVTVTTSSDQASFASLPREIRDKIYRLAIPRFCHIKLTFGSPQPSPSGSYRILSPQASTSMYANEACAMLFKRNRFRVYVTQLQVMLGEDGISSMFPFFGNYVHVVPKGRFDVKPWLRDIVIDITMEDKMDELAGRIGLLLECPALRRVEMVLHGGRSVLKRAIGTISSAVKALAEKLSRRLMFVLAVTTEDDYEQPEPGDIFIEDLKELETVARDETPILKMRIRILKEMRNE